MKASVYSRYGDWDELRVDDLELPAPGPGQVCVAVEAAGVNSWDVDLVRGTPRVVRLDGGLLKPKRPVIGSDVAGTVVQVGPGVSEFRVGDRVYGDLSAASWGAFAERANVGAAEVRRIPDGVGFLEAAATPQAATLAWQALQIAGAVAAGQRVLFNGAGGGVGTFGVQMAVGMGAEVWAVDRGDKLGLLSELGADHVIDYTNADFADLRGHFDLVVDNVASRPMWRVIGSLRPGGTYCVVGGHTWRLLGAALWGPIAARLRGRRVRILVHKANAGLDAIGEMLRAGSLRPVIGQVYGLDDVAGALEELALGNVCGKAVIAIGADAVVDRSDDAGALRLTTESSPSLDRVQGGAA